MTTRLKVGVVGTGSLGKQHARIYAEFAEAGQVEFVGVHDQDTEVAQAVAQRFGIPSFSSLEEIAAAATALSVATPTVTHHEISKALLLQGKHLLVEKPMAEDGGQAAELVQLAQKHSCVLQVGHVERFNPVFQYLQQVAAEPRFIEVHRLSPYPARSTDIGVVLDLMIHDLDIVMAFVNASVVDVDAVGIPVLSPSEDIANARLRFANGCIANLTASRISPERMRKIRVFSGGGVPSYISLDYRAQEGYIYRLGRDDEPESPLWKKLFQSREATIVSEFAGRRIVREPVPLVKEEPLKLELRHFVECIQAQQTPVVSGESARQALDLALEIARIIKNAR